MSKSPHGDGQTPYSDEKATYGGITYVTMHGTLNETFDSRKLAKKIGTPAALLDMRDVRRFASWGMAEWIDFLRATSERDLYIVECSTYAMSQLNIVTGLLGHAKLISFYASYRCTKCTEEMRTLFLIPRDRAAIRDIPNRPGTCSACGAQAKLEEYPAAFFDTLASRPAFDIDDEVLAFMRSRLNYDLSPDLTRFRAYRRAYKDYTYLGLSGSLDMLPADALAAASQHTTIVDLERVIFDPGQLGPWRDYIAAAIPRVRSLHLAYCPPGFLEHAVRVQDLGDKLTVGTFGVEYECRTCGARDARLVDVAANLEELVTGVVPSMRCSSCRATVAATVSAELASVVSALPARNRDVALDTFLARVRTEPTDKLDNALIRREVKRTAAPGPTGKGVYIALASSVIVAAVLVGVITRVWSREQQGSFGSARATPAVAPTPPTFTRPDWIVFEVPASGYCQDAIHRLTCIGTSSFTASKEDGVAEATDAALDELVHTLGLKISEPLFKDMGMPAYSAARAKLLSALQAADVGRLRDPGAARSYGATVDEVRKVRRRVVEVLKASGGAGVPAQRSDWYWEEYKKEAGTGTEFLVFVRYDIPLDAVRALADTYSASTVVLGSTVMTAFPALAWNHPQFAGGAFVVKVAPPLESAGVARKDIISAAGGENVADAAALAKRIQETTGELELTVATGDRAARVVRVSR